MRIVTGDQSKTVALDEYPHTRRSVARQIEQDHIGQLRRGGADRYWSNHQGSVCLDSGGSPFGIAPVAEELVK